MLQKVWNLLRNICNVKCQPPLPLPVLPNVQFIWLQRFSMWFYCISDSSVLSPLRYIRCLTISNRKRSGRFLSVEKMINSWVDNYSSHSPFPPLGTVSRSCFLTFWSGSMLCGGDVTSLQSFSIDCMLMCHQYLLCSI